MNRYENENKESVKSELSAVRKELAEWKAKGLELDITRGKPGKDA